MERPKCFGTGKCGLLQFTLCPWQKGCIAWSKENKKISLEDHIEFWNLVNVFKREGEEKEKEK
jgi:hypothetical protein